MIGQVMKLLPVLLGLKELLPDLTQLARIVPTLNRTTRDVQEFLQRSHEDRAAIAALDAKVSALHESQREVTACLETLMPRLEYVSKELAGGLEGLRRWVQATAALAAIALIVAITALLRG